MVPEPWLEKTCGDCPCVLCVERTWEMLSHVYVAGWGRKAGIYTGKLGSGSDLPKTDCTTMKMGKPIQNQQEKKSLKWKLKDKP